MNSGQCLHRLMWLSRPLMQRVEELVRSGLENTGLTVRMRAVLEILETRGCLTVPDIGRELQIQRQYVQVMVNEVISANLAEKRPNPRHRASPLVALTQQGETIISQVLVAERKAADQLAARFSDEDLRTALRVMEELHAELGRDSE